jgi:hypothetical protein
MEITRNGVRTAAGPSDWFTGAVFLDTVAAPSDASRLSATSVNFTPVRDALDQALQLGLIG